MRYIFGVTSEIHRNKNAEGKIKKDMHLTKIYERRWKDVIEKITEKQVQNHRQKINVEKGKSEKLKKK